MHGFLNYGPYASRRETLCHSLDGRALPLLTITGTDRGGRVGGVTHAAADAGVTSVLTHNRSHDREQQEQEDEGGGQREDETGACTDNPTCAHSFCR